MGLDRTRWPEVLVELERVEVLEVARAGDGRLHVAIETTDRVVACSGCGCRARVKDRDPVALADLPVFGSPVTLVWHKRRWRCWEPACPVGSWTEQRPDIAPARAAMTTREVGAEVHTVTCAAGQMGVAWHTVMDAVACWGQALIEDPDRVGVSEAVGVDETKRLAARRRVQRDSLGHRGRRHDPLYRIRKLLTLAAERLDERGEARLRGLLVAGDPDGEVHEAWRAKEALRDLYTFWGDEPVARQWLTGLITDCRAALSPEVRGMARTLAQWREPIPARHTTGHTNGPIEGLNSLIKKIKRIAAGFRSFANYRLRILLACGGCNWDLLGTPPR